MDEADNASDEESDDDADENAAGQLINPSSSINNAANAKDSANNASTSDDVAAEDVTYGATNRATSKSADHAEDCSGKNVGQYVAEGENVDVGNNAKEGQDASAASHNGAHN
ncbi:MAG: hypothetical protein LC808_33560 [Actinobacteria bacterium]|nr:hypothetical protein [Actinomycetota bacterium]